MKKVISAAFFLVCLTLLFSQNLTQTVRGNILDADNKLPLIGAQVVIIGANPVVGTVTDVNGNFRLENGSVNF